MMADGDVKIVLREEAINELLHAPEITAAVRNRAERAAAAANAASPMMGDHRRVPYDVVEHEGKRARFRVVGHHPGAINAEVKYRILGHAVDAARG